MKGTVIKEIKYKGYLIKPSVNGFKVFRKEYYIETYPTLQIAKHRIDNVALKHAKITIDNPENPKDPSSQETWQMKLF